MSESVTLVSQAPSVSLVMPQAPGDVTSDPAPAPVTEPAEPPVVEACTPEVMVAESSKVSITLLLVSGRRRTQEFDRKTTIGELKEVVWSTWPSEWSDELPPSAAFLRILYLGRILTDDTTLSSLNLAEPPESTVVHISVRSFAPPLDEDGKPPKKPKNRGTRRGRGREASGDAGSAADTTAAARGPDAEEESTGCCGCVIC